jgi:hypothetical protein
MQQVILIPIGNVQVQLRRRSRLDLDPAELVLAGDVPDRLRVQGSHVRLDVVEDLVVGSPAGDIAAFAVDDPCHDLDASCRPRSLTAPWRGPALDATPVGALT